MEIQHHELPKPQCGMLNAIGLQNKGVEVNQRERTCHFLAQFDTEIIANVAGAT